MMILIRHIVVIFLMGLLLSGCAVYSFNPGGKSSIKSIAVTQFENQTIESGLSSAMTDLVVQSFIADGNLSVVSESDADAVLVVDQMIEPTIMGSDGLVRSGTVILREVTQ